jgi:hypothetical protein
VALVLQRRQQQLLRQHNSSRACCKVAWLYQNVVVSPPWLSALQWVESLQWVEKLAVLQLYKEGTVAGGFMYMA